MRRLLFGITSLPLQILLVASFSLVAAVEFLALGGRADRARNDLMDTPGPATTPFDPREGTAGTALVAVSPILGKDVESPAENPVRLSASFSTTKPPRKDSGGGLAVGHGIIKVHHG